MSEDLRAYFAAEVPLPDWAERTAVIDYIVGYERRLEAAEYFDDAHVRALVERIVDRTNDVAASVMNHALAEEGELARGRLDEIAAPTLVIHGTADPLFPYVDILPALMDRDSRSRSCGVPGGSRRAGAGRRLARAYAPWSRGLRRDRQQGQSPGKNVLRGVGVRMVFMSAGNAPEHRLALAALRGDVAALAAFLRGVSGVDVDDDGAGRGGFLRRAGGEQPPAGRQDAPVQPGFLPPPVRQERARLSRVRYRLRLAHHIFGAQLLEHDQVVIPDEPGGDLLRPVFPAVGDRTVIAAIARRVFSRFPEPLRCRLIRRCSARYRAARRSLIRGTR